MDKKSVKCAGPDCKKDAVLGSSFCGESCRKASEKEVGDAPYGDWHHFPTHVEA